MLCFDEFLIHFRHHYAIPMDYAFNSKVMVGEGMSCRWGIEDELSVEILMQELLFFVVVFILAVYECSFGWLSHL